MVNTVVTMNFVLLSTLLSSVFATPVPTPWAPNTDFPVVDQWIQSQYPGKWTQQCNDFNVSVRKDFDSMTPEERQAYTAAVNCLRSKPSQLDQSVYSAATDRFMDYAVVHVNRTSQVHLDGFFFTWHRLFIYLFEKDLQQCCGYTGAFPYWNWAATANNLKGSAVFDGSPYSMSGDGEYQYSAPLILSSTLTIPHGSGGGCVVNGPFANMQTPMQPINASFMAQGLPLPSTAFQLNSSCLTRDLNTYTAQTFTNYDLIYEALDSTDFGTFTALVNGVAGSDQLGLHTGAHFQIGGAASNLYASPMDPIFYLLHTMLDNVYTSWQLRHPDIANALNGTMTASNVPTSAEVVLDSVLPDVSYLSQEAGLGGITIGELLSTTAGPFCYKYDVAL